MDCAVKQPRYSTQSQNKEARHEKENSDFKPGQVELA